MNISAPFIARPVATTLLTSAIALAGVLGFSKLPVSPLPQVDFPTISVIGASFPAQVPNTVATSVAEPLERHLGQIADVTEMTSQSGIGQTRITLQFDVSRDIDGAARDVQAAINAARADLPTNLASNPTYRKVNPADAPILILALTSKTMTQGQMYDAASNVLAQRLVAAQRHRQRHHRRLGTAGGARRAQSAGALQLRHRPRGRARRACLGQRQQPEGHDRRRRPALPDLHQRPGERSRRLRAAGHRLPQRRRRCACPTSPRVHNSVQDVRNLGMSEGQPCGAGHPLPSAGRQHHRDRRRREGGAAAPGSGDAGRHERRRSPSTAAPRSAPRCTTPS